MKKRQIITGALSAGLMLAAAPAALAGEWKQDGHGWWWQDDDGTYPVNEWRWLDGNLDQTAECYYFNDLGYLVTNTTTPDNYVVNENGEWVLDGQLQTQPAGIGAATVENIDAAAGIAGDTTGNNVIDGAAAGVIGNTAAETNGADDSISGSGVINVNIDSTGNTAAEAITSGDAAAWADITEVETNAALLGELNIDRTIGKNFIKQIFIECIGRERGQVEELLGTDGEIEETEDYAAGKFDFHINYVLDNHEDVRIDYKNNIAVRIFGTNTELLNFEKDEYTLSEIDAIFQVEHVALEGNAYFWHLQDEPDVTIELVDGYASLNAY